MAFSPTHPAFGPRRISAELAREKWGGIRISEHGVWRALCRVDYISVATGRRRTRCPVDRLGLAIDFELLRRRHGVERARQTILIPAAIRLGFSAVLCSGAMTRATSVAPLPHEHAATALVQAAIAKGRGRAQQE
ncbi:MAG TPA: hypothetical protein VKG38_07715 [Solirubrobacteraceae bacterium]|nr:hypothetical protein [Solirubrobacteraceae bacterium]